MIEKYFLIEKGKLKLVVSLDGSVNMSLDNDNHIEHIESENLIVRK